jgi:uncharacterized membrane protein
MNRTRSSVVGEYLRELQRSMKDLPSKRRDEILAEIEEHITEGLAELDSPTEADVRNVLERVGDPRDIAAEARQDADPDLTKAPARRRTRWSLGISALVIVGVLIGLVVAFVALGVGFGR